MLTQDRCYYWELVLVMRKVLMTSAFVLAQTPEEAWFLGSTVIVLALLLQDGPREEMRGQQWQQRRL